MEGRKERQEGGAGGRNEHTKKSRYVNANYISISLMVMNFFKGCNIC